jgi:hypothetical protein
MKKLYTSRIIFVLLLASSAGICLSQHVASYKDNIIDSVIFEDGRVAYAIIVPGIPPEHYTGPEAVYDRGSKILPLVPAFNWSFGCSATSAAMIAGHYDNMGYPNMYVGPTNNGVMPMDNSSWPDVVINGQNRHNCPLSATANGLDGRTTAGHVNDYWILYGAPGPDPWTVAGGGSGVQHTYGHCTGDYMKTNQWINGTEGYNTDGSTTFWYWNNGSPMTAADMESNGWDDDDGCYGFKLFYQSRGYTVTTCFSQQIVEEGLTYGFSFNQYKAEIDAGRPVLIHVTDHTMVGYGYNDDGGAKTVYIHDTWDYLDHSMTWGGNYGGLHHYAVSVVNLQASTINVWNGSFNNYWGNSSNWSLGHVPLSTETVVIPDLNTPVIVDYSNKVANYLYVYPGATLRIMGYELTVSNDLYVGGTIQFNNNAAVLTVGDDIYWQNGSSVAINTTTAFAPAIYVSGDWEFQDGSNVQFTNGVADFQGASTTWIRCKSSGSYFNHIRNNKTGGAFLALSGTCTQDVVVGGNMYMYAGSKLSSSSNYNLTINGFLNNMNGNITLDAGTLKFNGYPGTTGLKMNTGDYLRNLVVNTGSYALQLDNTYSNTLWLKGSLTIQSGYFYANAFTIKIEGNWTNSAGPVSFIEGTSRVIFQGAGNQYIYGDENFNILEANTGGQIRISNSTYDIVCNSYDWTAGGIYVSAGNFTANDLADNGVFGSYTLYSPGTIDLYQDASSWIDLNASLNIYSGVMNINGGSGSSYWAYANPITVNIDNGILNFRNNGIYLSGNHLLTEDISGGTVKTVGGFNGGSRSDFHPAGGTFEFYGTSDQSITLGNNSLYSVTINKGSTTDGVQCPVFETIPALDGQSRKVINSNGSRSNTIFLGDSLELAGNLTITSGVLDVSGSNYPVLLGGNWTNNVGTAGFNERSGKVIFNGATISDIVTAETFYDLVEDKTSTSIYALEIGTGNGLGVDINVLHDLSVLDGSLEINSPCNLTVSNNVIISDGATINANDSPTININVGLLWTDNNSTGGFDAGSYSVVTFNAAPTDIIQVVRETSYFNDIVINSSAPYIRPHSGTKVIRCRDMNIISGQLRVSGYRVVVDDTLYNSGNITMNNALDTLEVGFIDWKPGSTDGISAGKIFVSRDWIWENGTNATITAGNTVYFTGGTTGFIKAYDPEARFYNMEVNKTGSSLWIHSSSDQPVHINNYLTVGANALLHVQYGDLIVDGMTDVVNTATMRLYNGGSVELASDFTLNGFVDLSGGGDFLAHGLFSQAATGRIDMDGGTFIADKVLSEPRAIFSMGGTLNQQGGIFEISHNHLSLNNTFVENITAGTIRIGGSLIASDGVFTPAGGTVEFIPFSGGGSPYIDLKTGNWFNHLTINGPNSWGVYLVQDLYIKGDLLIQQGNLNAFNDNIYLAGDWTNNAGSPGFSEGTGTVYLNGTSPLDIQFINGETFYNLSNLNTQRHINIAGNTVVTNNFDIGAGGSACSVVVTSSLLSVGNELDLSAGALGLSTSAPIVTAGTLRQGGTLEMTNGTFTANDLIENHLIGDYTLHNGTINLYQDGSQYTDLDCDIVIHNGNFNIYGGTSDSYWPFTGSGSLTMDGGVLEFMDVGITFYNNSFTENVTGGTIRTPGNLNTFPGISFFTPAGGTFEFTGAGSSNISLESTCYFHDLKINKSPDISVNAYSPLNIKNELKVSGGKFNTNNFLITVGE